MTLPAQRVLGAKYRLVRPLVAGGMGTLWIAEHLTLRSAVAVKLLSREIAETEEGEQRFLREARTAASLRSPHVVQILDHGVDDGTPYIVMELLDGESLATRLQRETQLSPGHTERVVRHVARAVARAHEAGIVHRDLKPSNIFIVANDEEEIVKVLDFGIAKTSEEWTSSLAGRTRTGTFLGTPGYVSPEQAEGASNIDFRTDIWSLGVIAYECLLGRPPFVGESFGSLLLAICSRPLPIPSEHGPLPRGFDEWFARACARDPAQRYQSAREASQELRRLVDLSDGESISSGSFRANDSARARGGHVSGLRGDVLEPPVPVAEPFASTSVASSSGIPPRAAPARGHWLLLVSALSATALGLLLRSCFLTDPAERPREAHASEWSGAVAADELSLKAAPAAVLPHGSGPRVAPVPQAPSPKVAVVPPEAVTSDAVTSEALASGTAAAKTVPLGAPEPRPLPERRVHPSKPAPAVSKPPAAHPPATGSALRAREPSSINLGLTPPERTP